MICSKYLVVVTLLAIVAISMGCGDDPITPKLTDPPGTGTIDPNAGSFEITLASAVSADTLLSGPFVLRGANIRYDDDLQALLVDLTIRNAGDNDLPNPVAINIRPQHSGDVVVLNPVDAGGFLEFEFANDDLVWPPGEISLPLTLRLRVAPRTSVGFATTIRVGPAPQFGLIAGRVWHDLDQDGLMDPDEPGLPGIILNLDINSDTGVVLTTVSGPDGQYAFTDLRPSMHRVFVHTPEGLTATTEREIQVLLVGDVGFVARYENAHFGVWREPDLAIGPSLVVSGLCWPAYAYGANRHSLVCDVLSDVLINVSLTANPLENGGELSGVRYGWDLIDREDPDDPGWALAPGLTPLHFDPPAQFLIAGLHEFTAQATDELGGITWTAVPVDVFDADFGTDVVGRWRWLRSWNPWTNTTITPEHPDDNILILRDDLTWENIVVGVGTSTGTYTIETVAGAIVVVGQYWDYTLFGDGLIHDSTPVDGPRVVYRYAGASE